MTDIELAQSIWEHLDEVQNNSSATLNEQLLEKLHIVISESLPKDARIRLLGKLVAVLPTLIANPGLITTLIEILVRPASFTFSDVASIEPTIDLLQGLSVPIPPINLASLSLLGKAAEKPGDSAIIAGKPEIVAALVTLWLQTPDTTVASKALDVVVTLLESDLTLRTVGEQKDLDDFETERSQRTRPTQQGLMWRRIFKDRDIYSIFYSVCSLTTIGKPGQASKREKTIAQGRLIEMVERLITTSDLSVSQIPEVEQMYNVKEGGLLDFVALQMVDYKDDVLMHITLMDFFANLLKLCRVPSMESSIASMSAYNFDPIDFMISRDLHSRTISYWLEPDKHDALDINYLYSRSANYLAAYAEVAPSHLLQAKNPSPDSVLRQLSNVLDRLSSSALANENAPQYDLHVLASLPLIALLPRPQQDSPLLTLPLRPPNADIFRTLAHAFRGPIEAPVPDQMISSISSLTSIHQDPLSSPHTTAVTARALYLLYLERNPDFWSHVVSVADTIALKQKALAAIDLIRSIIDANWLLAPTDPEGDGPFKLPTESQLERQCHRYRHPLPDSGVTAILTSPVLEVVLPYLMKPAQTFSHLAGGRGDVDSAAYKVAAAKHDTLGALHRRLVDSSQSSVPMENGSWQDLIAAVRRRLLHGPLGESSDVGGNVGTMEM